MYRHMRSRRCLSSLDDIVNVIGEEALEALVAEFGGLRVFVPGVSRMHPKHPVAKAIGVKAATALSHYLTFGIKGGGSNVNVPRLWAANAKKPLIAVAQGSNREVAKRFGVTERWVSQCRRGSR
jgi:hypothetical protein